MQINRLLFLASFLLIALPAFSQSSQNISLFGTLNPEPVRYSGSWSYTAPMGEEYALIGAFNGTSIISIDDSTNIYEVDWVAGPGSRWREITVIGDHAYVVTEGDSGDTGMQVLDLSFLPDSVQHVTTFDSTFLTSHIIERDILGDPNYVYVCGTDPGATRGVHIIDVSNPAQPVEISTYAPNYAHDCHVRGDTMYVAAIYDGYLDVVDISDKTNPVRITQVVYPGAFTHSCWTTKDNRYLFLTDEIDGLLANIYDISDLNNINQVATYSANLQSLVHNCYIRGDFGFISHNTEGLRVVDLAKPDVPVEVGHYDTWPGPSGGFEGLWSACPYFPSGKIIGANRNDGLYVWRFNNTYAGRIYGQVLDSVTGLPIQAAEIRILQTSDSTLSRTNGTYAFGAVPAGPAGYTVQYAKPGYVTRTLQTPLSGQDSLHYVVRLQPLGVGAPPAVPTALHVYPTTTQGALKVDHGAANQSTLRLYDLKGQLLHRWNFKGSGQHTIHLEFLANGAYLYQLESKSAGKVSGKIILRK